MVFSNPTFLFFFLPLVLIANLLTPKQLKNLLLLSASLIFYAWGEGFYVLVMLASILVNYLVGLAISNTKYALLALNLGVAINLVLLGTFKYANFIVDNINLLLAAFDIQAWNLAQVHLPIGISFFTFQAISYIIDVYRKDAPVQKNIINMALFIALFPQLIAGPIVRYITVAGQIVERQLTLKLFHDGLTRFIIGFAKKVILADAFAYPADQIFSTPASELSFVIAWFGLTCYALQIYYDFTGYSDMAIGLGKMFGFTFPENFNYPYISLSIGEFWRRWHISLVSWFRDYVYIPLGGSHKGKIRNNINLFTIFFLSGIWHGAAWTFVIWGCMHGLMTVFERSEIYRSYITRFKPIQYLFFIWFIMMTWVMFRSETLEYALNFYQIIYGLNQGNNTLPINLYLNAELIALLFIGSIGLFPVIPKMIQLSKEHAYTEKALTFAQPLALLTLFMYSILIAVSGAYSPFIYFRF